MEAQKAYEIKALMAKFKARGLDLAEDAARMVVEETCNWVIESAVISENKIDDVVALGIPQLKQILLPLVDKIDGKVG